MKFQNFETRTFGKWILAGEHTVLRGGKALVFPLRSRFLDFQFSPRTGPRASQNLEIEIPKGYPEEFKLLFWSVFEKACQMKGLGSSQFSGLVQMRANIPVGSGLGASAALCVALARWFESLNIINHAEAFDFAKNLEDVFHGESSGVDVAVVLSEQGLLFQRQGPREIFQAKWQPEWYLSHSGQKGITKECVQKVQAMGLADPARLQTLDSKMKLSVEKCGNALMSKAQNKMELIEALDLANDVFHEWGLVNSTLDHHLNLLKKSGSLAMKPTGSGLGGFVLSLWEKPPVIEGVEFLKATVVEA
jgi:mevalonate kinase